MAVSGDLSLSISCEPGMALRPAGRGRGWPLKADVYEIRLWLANCTHFNSTFVLSSRFVD